MPGHSSSFVMTTRATLVTTLGALMLAAGCSDGDARGGAGGASSSSSSGSDASSTASTGTASGSAGGGGDAVGGGSSGAAGGSGGAGGGGAGWTVAASPGSSSEVRALATTATGVVAVGTFQGEMTFGGAKLGAVGIVDAFVAKLDLEGNLVWSTSWGSTDNDDASAVAVLPSGDVVVATTCRGAVTIGAVDLPNGGDDDVVVAVLSGTTGAPLAVTSFPAPEFQVALDVGVTAGGQVVVSGFQLGTMDWGGGPLVADGNQAFTLTLAPDLSFVSATLLGTIAEYAPRFAFGPAGMAVAGALWQTTDWGTGPMVSNGGKDALTARYDATGAALWARHDGDGSDQVGTAVALDASGGVIAGGQFSGALDLGVGSPYDAIREGWVARFDADGAPMWSTVLEASIPSSLWVSGVADLQGGAIVVGQAAGPVTVGAHSVDFDEYRGFAARLDDDGAALWLTEAGPGTSGIAGAVAVGGSGSLFLGGEADGLAWVTMREP